jgi:hypothetical protein
MTFFARRCGPAVLLQGAVRPATSALSKGQWREWAIARGGSVGVSQWDWQVRRPLGPLLQFLQIGRSGDPAPLG